ncbi:hypothetical protein ABCW43_00050 [Neorhizobium sp. IRAMC:178]|uniref:hypothetical protein n=1 Tax=Neorhizobium tunisiense TaxID=3144793 RepID=UPI0031F70002
MSKDVSQFARFLAAIFIPALISGIMLDAGANGGVIAAFWLVTTLLAVGYVVDGLKGAKALLTGTLHSWAILVIAGLLIGLLAMAKFGHSP